MYAGAHPPNQTSQPFDLPRPYKDGKGHRRQPGLKDLPAWLRETFRDRFIRRVIEQVCLNNTPWNNPALSSLQLEFNHAYPTHRIRLHSDDAGVVPVSFDDHPALVSKFSPSVQMLRDLGVLRNQIGNEGLVAVIEHLPTQYNKRMLVSKDARAGYIAAVLANPQRPFIWELFRPGTQTVPRPGYNRGYYDEVIPMSRKVYTILPSFWVETKRTVPVDTCPPGVLNLLYLPWCSS
jgi:hypothetical protein